MLKDILINELSLFGAISKALITMKTINDHNIPSKVIGS
jgi:hypothetical protein